MSVTTDDPELFLATSDLELVARAVVEGALAGLHRSPWIGSSVEFESHRDYQRGDIAPGPPIVRNLKAKRLWPVAPMR